MKDIFPSEGWLNTLMEKLNTDEKYGRIARGWEGDLAFDILPSGALEDGLVYYLDLWHGKCRSVEILSDISEKPAAFILKASYDNFVDVLTGKTDALQAMLTRKLQVTGSMAYMMRNVPTVLEFVRCAKEITSSYVGQGQDDRK
jgi:putative sterol carrier protein